MHASGAAAPTSSVPCQFYRLGTCRYGSRCRFLHDAPAAPATRASPTPGGREHCRFFDAGRCRCGAQCRFAHAAHVAEEIAGEPRVPDRPPALQAPPARPPAEQAPAVPFELFHRIADFLEAGVEGHQYSRFADTVVLAQTCRALRAQLAGRLRRRFLELLREWDVEVYASLVLNFDPRRWERRAMPCSSRSRRPSAGPAPACGPRETHGFRRLRGLPWRSARSRDRPTARARCPRSACPTAARCRASPLRRPSRSGSTCAKGSPATRTALASARCRSAGDTGRPSSCCPSRSRSAAGPTGARAPPGWTPETPESASRSAWKVRSSGSS
ncbi:hypothetical protein DFJ74DRAFT_694212 [Hyaloraphidium curvatum]|nr:hypothetical protein DFJ74DRAFT_694212 [Hyaloraphidium curvatum]